MATHIKVETLNEDEGLLKVHHDRKEKNNG